MFKHTKCILLALLLLTSLLAGCAGEAPTSSTTPAVPSQQGTVASPGTPTAKTEVMPLTVYYATKDAMYLVPEMHRVPRNSHPAQTAVELLLIEPQNQELVRVLPTGTKLKSLAIKENIAYVNFSEQLIKNNQGGSAAEILQVSSIVNTLTEFPDIHQVQILVEGKKVETISGHVDISEPLSRSTDIIKKL